MLLYSCTNLKVKAIFYIDFGELWEVQMRDKSSIYFTLILLTVLFLDYLSSGNPGFLVTCLGGVAWLVFVWDLFDFSRIGYYAALLCAVILQSIILINTYLFQTTYLQNNSQYATFICGVGLYLINIALILKPSLSKSKS
jgi:hypothetical protein